MRGLDKRVTALEGSGSADLSPRVKAWLGWGLTAAEQAALDAGGDVDTGNIDTSNWSREAREWLDID